MQTIQLKTPLKVNGKDLTELPCDMDGITPEAYIKAEALANDKRGNEGSAAVMAEIDYGFHLYLGFMGIIAADSKIDISDLERVKGRDLVKIASVGRFFALGTDAEDSAESSSDDASGSTPTSTAAARTR